MRDVASRAGVSAQTVSNLVNGRVHLMTEATRERVSEAMSALGYHPNSAARGLRSARSHTLAFLVLDQDARFLADPMTDLIIAGIGDIARDRGYGVLIQAGRPEQASDALLTPLLEHRADGAFLFLSGEPELRRWYISRVTELGARAVVFERVDDAPNITSLTAADRDGARRLTEHLLSRGHRRIAFVAARVPWPMIEQRRLGYRDALAAGSSVLTPAGTAVRGHEFHRTTVAPGNPAAPAWSFGGKEEGFVRAGVHASYLHLHWAGYPDLARRVVAAAA